MTLATCQPVLFHEEGLGADGLMAAGGYYQMASDQVTRFRTAVDEQRRGSDLEKRLDALRVHVRNMRSRAAELAGKKYGSDHRSGAR